ncbi:hypothetical protein MATR_07550 [Marivirga tractuosa]|uniref:Uncharacterized protein n=1 Tax=Marivirga tractuosa (strain ATCC 23168 / DSM 4126 / NBRC 15989 / NCIMB 1408 / VKM B-1430 / H-43) TaxID=643867 RepID=E4TQ68_MARTH|nr:hypothetical protein [Marivirga tractuosa]ADR21614.1 hypothetical protein Ftrac_1625 [Marivirga tractuosa DSM 4126]BDD13930.1 hypothetical protein MATR_07550 [Marivirga tractuosa]
MKSVFYLLIPFLTINSAYAQTLTGIVQSSEDGLSIEGAHVVNISKNEMAISSQMGNFTIVGEIGDTLIVSNINYIKRQFIVNTKNRISILLTPNLIQLEEVIVSNLPKTANDFRKKLIAMPMQDNGKFLPYGMKPAKTRSEIPPLYNRSLNSGLGYVVMNPLKSITRKLSSEYQEKVKYYALKADEDDKILRDKKFNRALVASLTKLEADELTNFIHFMDLADSFISNASDYEIAKRIQEELKKYQNEERKE